MTLVVTKWYALCVLPLCGLIALADVSVTPTFDPSTTPTTTQAAATTQALPTAQQLIDRFIEVTGGLDAYASIVSRHVEADYEMADLGVTGKLVADIRNDGNARQTITVPNLDSFVEGITGETAWSTSQTGGPRILTGLEAQLLRQSLSFAPEASLDPYRSATVNEVIELNGVPCYKMVLTPKAIDTVETRYYDIKTGYLIRRDGSVLTSEGSISIITRYGDYEDAPPIRMAMKIRQSMSGLSPEQVITRVRHNVEMPDELFALPADVLELQTHRPTTKPSH
jgi:hypothetical protein